MSDYLPVNLIHVYNVGIRFWGSDADPKLGGQTFHGLPFEIGEDPEKCFLGFSSESAPTDTVTISVEDKAYNIIFAHALLETRITEGDNIGQPVAHYAVHFDNGEVTELPVRERFEVSVIPTSWGQFPFLAVPDQKSSLMPRHGGSWDRMGQRQAEVIYPPTHDYYLWAWKNPHPDWAIARITITPANRKFIVAAITLSQVEEPPFVRQGRVPVKITLPLREDADQKSDLEVEVDRGVATYTYPLPQATVDEFLADDFKGFGETQNRTDSPSFVEVAAIPSATLAVKSGGETLGTTTWGELQERVRVETSRVTLEVVDQQRNWVRVTVVDDDTGRTVPCRIHFRSLEGIPYQPDGHHNHVNRNLSSWHSDIGGDVRLGQITYAYINGTCQGWLPRGKVIVDVARGFEFEPLRETVYIAPGQQELLLRLKRWTDMNARRWFSGDSHVHFLGAQGAHYEAEAEDLNVVNLLASQWGHLFTNTEDFTGRPSVSHDGKTIIYVSQENRQHILGHLTLWGLVEPVFPRGSGGVDEGALGGTLDVTLSAWADATHAQGGTVIIPHLPDPNGEPAVLVTTGRADAVEMLQQTDYNHLEYYRYLNAGYRLPLVGGTDKMDSGVPVGLYRTYAFIPHDQPFDYETWTQAVRAGRTFLSGGPMLSFTVEGKQIGDTLQLPRGGGTVEVEATAECVLPMHTLQIVQQGQVVASTESELGSRQLHLVTTLSVDRHTWLAARCGGPNYTTLPHHDSWRRGVFAHTSPIYVAVEDEWKLFDASTASYLLTLVEGGLAHIRQRAAHYPPGKVLYHHGEADHLAYLERPFKEAIQIIHRRMHEFGIPH